MQKRLFQATGVESNTIWVVLVHPLKRDGNPLGIRNHRLPSLPPYRDRGKWGIDSDRRPATNCCYVAISRRPLFPGNYCQNTYSQNLDQRMVRLKY